MVIRNEYPVGGTSEIAQRREACRGGGSSLPLGSEARDAAVALALATADSNESVLEWASAALEDLGPPPVSTIDELATMVVGDQAGPAYWAATLLGRLGPAAQAAAPALAQATTGPWPEVRKRAAWAIEKISAG
jgi:hypothetical protein